uniref:RNA polymerase II elongation factor ELL N-terminal domain-containing protein n=1 Tax=Amphilophus citrinellus TaxID=61819 RepID=A0A3Q0STT5_AMPCI
MASLRQEHHYGLSCGKNNKNSPNRTLYHVKLTDTAIRALEAYQNFKGSLSSEPSICFKESQGVSLIIFMCFLYVHMKVFLCLHISNPFLC